MSIKLIFTNIPTVHRATKNQYINIIDVGTGGHWGARAPQDFKIDKEVPFFLKEKVPAKRRNPQV